jgi:hypothetical protein
VGMNLLSINEWPLLTQMIARRHPSR